MKKKSKITDSIKQQNIASSSDKKNEGENTLIKLLFQPTHFQFHFTSEHTLTDLILPEKIKNGLIIVSSFWSFTYFKPLPVRTNPIEILPDYINEKFIIRFWDLDANEDDKPLDTKVYEKEHKFEYFEAIDFLVEITEASINIEDPKLLKYYYDLMVLETIKNKCDEANEKWKIQALKFGLYYTSVLIIDYLLKNRPKSNFTQNLLEKVKIYLKERPLNFQPLGLTLKQIFTKNSINNEEKKIPLKQQVLIIREALKSIQKYKNHPDKKLHKLVREILSSYNEEYNIDSVYRYLADKKSSISEKYKTLEKKVKGILRDYF